MARERISTIKMLRPEDVWQPRIGAPLGNRNGLKTGLHTAEVRDLRRRIRAFHVRVNALLKEVDDGLKASSSFETRSPALRPTTPQDEDASSLPRREDANGAPHPEELRRPVDGAASRRARRSRPHKATGPHDGGPEAL